MTELIQNIHETTEYLKKQGVNQIDFGLILGSGLGEMADEIENPLVIPYESIPHFKTSNVIGHAGKLVYGVLGNKKVLAMQGRFHYYEGYSMHEVTYPIRIMKALDAHSLLVTNASGGVNETFVPGDLMLITDHINAMGTNPLIGKNLDEFGPRFPDMTQAYDLEYQALIKEVAQKQQMDLKTGIYMAFTGPSYETPAEIKYARTIGSDAVGMSTVPEVIVANHCQMRVLGISAITNKAAGMQKELNHDEVVLVTTKIKAGFKVLIKDFLENA